MPRHADAYRGLAHASRLKVLAAVLNSPGIDLATLARVTGLHSNTIRDHMRVLEHEGFVRGSTERTGGRGRPRKVYRPVRGTDSHAEAEKRVRDAMHRGDLMRKVARTDEHLDPEATHQIDALYEHLDDVGLLPDVDEDALTVDLTPCMFDSMVAENQEIACQVHTELIKDVLVRAGGPVELDRLLPYRTPKRCRVYLAMAGTAAEPENSAE